MLESQSSAVRTRIGELQPLWVLVGPRGTLLCGRHAQAGPLVLAWTTRDEMEAGVEELFGRAPALFETHTPEQRSFGSLLETAARLHMGLRIDEYVVAGLERAEKAN